jgi:hypothetical protein
MATQQTSRDCPHCQTRTLHAREVSGSGCAIAVILVLVLCVLAFPFAAPLAVLIGAATLAVAVLATILDAPAPYRCARCGTAAPQVDGLALRLAVLGVLVAVVVAAWPSRAPRVETGVRAAPVTAPVVVRPRRAG